MSEVQSAALMLIATTLVFISIAFFLRRRRSNAAATPGAPRLANPTRAPLAWKFPRFARRERVVEVQVDMDPARLARISGKPPADPTSDADTEEDRSVADSDAAPPAPPSPHGGIDEAAISATLETMATQVEQRAHHIETLSDAPVLIRLIPQIAPNGDEAATSWLGGRPCLDPGADWPEINERPALFLGQIDCTDLPADLWDGLGPRTGALAIFVHPRDAAVAIVAVDDPGEPIDAPYPPSRDSPIFAPADIAPADDLLPFARAAFPAWPVKLITVRAGDPDPQRPAPDAWQEPRAREAFDLADPAFHPFDWDSMIAMVDILAMRIETIDVDDTPNREARARAEEIIAIVRDSAGRDPFAPEAAAAVMDALHQIRWVGAESLPLPLTAHDPRAPLWAHDYRAIWFDHAKHAFARDPGLLSPAARAQFELEARALAAQARSSIGPIPKAYIAGYDAETHVTLLELPSSGLMSWAFGDSASLTLTMRKADLAAGRWDRAHAQFGA